MALSLFLGLFVALSVLRFLGVVAFFCLLLKRVGICV